MFVVAKALRFNGCNSWKNNIIPAVSITLTFKYTGYEIDVTKGTTGVEYGNIKNFDTTLMYITEDSTTKFINVSDELVLKITLKDPNNYQWANAASSVLIL